MCCKILVGIAFSFAWLISTLHVQAEEKVLTLHARKQVNSAASKQPETAETLLKWQPRQTALIICDMWDDHWCQGAARRVTEMAPEMNKVVQAMRAQGVLIVHAPSTCVDFYKESPARKRAMEAKFAKPPQPLATVERWGTAWCYPVKDREAELPIDDTDMGCDCAKKCTIAGPWKRQIKTIEIDDADVITDNGQELYNVFAARDIKHVMIMGVHLNMCVLGRPFGIRELSNMQQDVVLVRDMTDTMYNSQMRPKVNHFTGTDLVVEHIEKYWCPTITSVDLVGGKPFRFMEDKR
ncbi:MAG TPA: isochorismatase family protein [Pirellulaceae bacterium]|nr:isochorismatase family protein [Pirellulaceae bacterium]